MKEKRATALKSSVKAAYNAIAPQFSRTRQQPWREFEAFLPYVKSGDRILDVGCGNGRLFGFLQKHLEFFDYLGVDQSDELLKLARRQHSEVEFLEQDMEYLSVEPNSFDALFSIAAFHHLPTPTSRQAAVQKMHIALKVNGVLILTIWNLFQLNYSRPLFKALISSLFHFGQKLAWNDLWIPWAHLPKPRYYHAFTPRELHSFFPSDQWNIEDVYFTRKGHRTTFWKSFNIVLVARKKEV